MINFSFSDFTARYCGQLFVSDARGSETTRAIPLILAPPPTGILARIVSHKREELRSAAVPATDLRHAAESRRANRRDFAAALRAKRPAIISEIKKASPSKGLLVEDFRPAGSGPPV